MKVVVTGHKGYIGTILVPMLIERGHEVLGIDIDLFSNFDFPHDKTQIKEIIKDIRNVTQEDMEGYDAVIHLASLSNDPMGELDPGLTKEINFEGSKNVAVKAKAAGVKRFVFSSSCSVYGITDSDAPVTENSPLDPITEYAKSKIEFEKFLSSIADDNFSPVMMRNATVYGFSPSLRMDLVVHSLTAYGYFTNKINILSDGRPWRPLIHIQDLCTVFCEMLEAPIEKIHDQVFNTGFNDENYRIKDIANLVQEVMPGTEITIAKSFDPDSRSYRVGFNKLNEALHIKNQWNVKKGSQELYDFFKKGLMTREDFENHKHARLNQLKSFNDKKFFEIKNK